MEKTFAMSNVTVNNNNYYSVTVTMTPTPGQSKEDFGEEIGKLITLLVSWASFWASFGTRRYFLAGDITQIEVTCINEPKFQKCINGCWEFDNLMFRLEIATAFNKVLNAGRRQLMSDEKTVTVAVYNKQEGTKGCYSILAKNIATAHDFVRVYFYDTELCWDGYSIYITLEATKGEIIAGLVNESGYWEIDETIVREQIDDRVADCVIDWNNKMKDAYDQPETDRGLVNKDFEG